MDAFVGDGGEIAGISEPERVLSWHSTDGLLNQRMSRGSFAMRGRSV